MSSRISTLPKLEGYADVSVLIKDAARGRDQYYSDEDTAALSRFIVTEFFRRTGISVHGCQLDESGPVATRVRATVATWDLGDIPSTRVQKHIVTAISIATTTFGHTHLSTQEHIALFTLLLLCIDDLEVDSGALAEFVRRLQSGMSQLHPVLELLVEKMRAMHKFFPPYAASAIHAGIIHFVNETVFEKQAEGMVLHPTAYPYVLYKRSKNSLGEVYSACVWDLFNFPDVATHVQILPETMIYLDYANDILSFYKEELAGEQSNFVHDRANVTGKSVRQVLLDILNEVVSAVERARLILQGEQEKRTWEQFLAGYVAFHFLSPRYRLAELTGTEYL